MNDEHNKCSRRRPRSGRAIPTDDCINQKAEKEDARANLPLEPDRPRRTSPVILSSLSLCLLVFLTTNLPLANGYAFRAVPLIAASRGPPTTTNCLRRHPAFCWPMRTPKNNKNNNNNNYAATASSRRLTQKLGMMMTPSSSFGSEAVNHTMMFGASTSTADMVVDTTTSMETVSAIATATAAVLTTNDNSAVNGNAVNGNHIMTSNGALSSSSSSSESGGGGLPDWLQQKVDESMLAQEQDFPHPTDNGGYSHTSASKAKISAANKGRTPWNKGKGRSEEVKARIAAGVRKTNRERFLVKLQAMGVTEDDYNANRAKEKSAKQAATRARRTEKGGYRPTAETKAKISKILKAKWANGEVKKREMDPTKVRRGFTHSEETRAKISASLRKRWATDDDYRANMLNKTMDVNSNPVIRKKISDTLRKKWEDPDFRANMTANIAKRSRPTGPHGISHREKISAAMKAKWQDETYRKRATEAMQKRQAELMKTRPPPSIKKPKLKKAKPPKPNKRVTSRQSTSSSSSSTADAAGSDIDSIAESAGPRLAQQPMSIPKPKVKGAGKAAPRKSVKIVEAKAITAAAATHVKKLKKKKVKQKAAVALDPASPVDPTSATAKPKTKKAKKENKKKEPPGSKTRLREERRDLYDLLYGDEDDDHRTDDEGDEQGSVLVSGDGSSPNRKLASVFLEDENLDDFDPYGLENF